MCGFGGEEGAGKGRQNTQDIEKGNGLKNEGRCICTATLGLPPVFSGPVALFIACVYAVFVLAPMILHVDPLWVLFHPCSQQ